jgi:hypothetical protein
LLDEARKWLLNSCTFGLVELLQLFPLQNITKIERPEYKQRAIIEQYMKPLNLTDTR